jgi:hypothetical protein
LAPAWSRHRPPSSRRRISQPSSRSSSPVSSCLDPSASQTASRPAQRASLRCLGLPGGAGLSLQRSSWR